MKKTCIILSLMAITFTGVAQDDSSTVTKGFKKDHLFTGGGITLSFSSNGSVLGASPVLGYRITKWLDAGVVLNFIYATQRHYAVYSYDDKLKQTIIGPGAFLKIYPINFLFVQAQVEKNFMRQTLIPDDAFYPRQSIRQSAWSTLVGAGYCNGREQSNDVFYYVSLLFDVAKNKNSPYVEQTQNGNVNVLPIIRAGLQIPLFQNKKLF